MGGGRGEQNQRRGKSSRIEEGRWRGDRGKEAKVAEEMGQ